MNCINKFFSKKYRIRHIDGYGYVAEVKSWGWWAIRDDGTKGDPDFITVLPKVFLCKTEKEAHERVALSRSSSQAIWSSR